MSARVQFATENHEPLPTTNYQLTTVEVGLDGPSCRTIEYNSETDISRQQLQMRSFYNESRCLPEVLIIGIALVLRLWGLEAKPPHFDEGVNGWFADQMTAWGCYRYDPTNYHGPFYFYLVYLFKTLFGRELWALRMPAVIASVLSVFWMLRFAEFFGRRPARIAALAMAVSPACVFYGRYSIHEFWLVLFTMGFIWGLLGIWKNGTPKYLYAALISFAGMIITKETWIISIAAAILALCVLFLWQKVVPSEPDIPWSRKHWMAKDLFAGITIIILAVVVFYSGFFQDPAGIRKFFESFSAWFHTGLGETSGHEKKEYQFGFLNYYWLDLIVRYEWPALLGLLACVPLIGKASSQRRFLALYAVGVVCAYSIIPYKTPWLIISLLWPFFLLFGNGVDDLLQIKEAVPFQKFCLWGITALAFLASLFLCIRLNFFRATDEREPYVYVQTYPEIRVFTDPPIALAHKNPRNYGLRGMVLLESYYPIPWILGDFPHIGYYHKLSQWPKTIDADFIVTLDSNAPEVEKRLHQSYYKKRFRLRSGMKDCIAYFRTDVFH